MRTSIIFLFLIFFITIIPDTIGQATVNKNGVKIGVSQGNITPDVPILMAGYSERTTPFTGVNDSLYAQVILFSDGKTKILIVTSDLIGYNFELVDDVKKMISSKIDIPVENIMISAAHNHGGPEMRKGGPKALKETNDYIQILKEKLTKLSFEASMNLVPFKMGIATGVCKMNINRRLEAPQGITLGLNPDGPCDTDLGVAKFVDMNDKIIAVLINWPAHGTVSGKENYLITGDWPGAAARHIKQQSGQDIIVGVTAGASGDIAPLYGPASRLEKSELIGYQVAKQTWKAISDIAPFPVETLQVLNEKLSLPGKKSGKAIVPSETNSEIRLSVFKIGNLVLAGISGEVMTEIGMQIKDLSPYSNTHIVTHTNGSSGYICTDKAYPEGGYEVGATRIMPGVEALVVKKVSEMINAF